MNDIISKYIPLTVEELKSELSFTYNVLAIFSVLFIVCLLIFILREVIFLKNNKKKLDLDKRDFNFFDFFQATVMGISLVVVILIFKRIRNIEKSSIWRNCKRVERCFFI